MSKFKIQYARAPLHGAEDLPPDVVELWIGVSARRVNVNIVRRGFILASPVMHIINERIKRLALATASINKPLPERIGFSPELSPESHQFLDELRPLGLPGTTVGRGPSSACMARSAFSNKAFMSRPATRKARSAVWSISSKLIIV